MDIYISDFLQTLAINDKTLRDNCINLLDQLLKINGLKRALVKDGLILISLQYLSNNRYNAYTLGKIKNIPTKYISKAEDILIESIKTNKVHINNTHTMTPIDFLRTKITEYNLSVSNDIIYKTDVLFNKNKHIITNHTPKNICITCLYFLLCDSVDIHVFSNIFEINYKLLLTILQRIN